MKTTLSSGYPYYFCYLHNGLAIFTGVMVQPFLFPLKPFLLSKEKAFGSNVMYNQPPAPRSTEKPITACKLPSASQQRSVRCTAMA